MARQLLATKSIAELHEQESTGNQLRRALTATQLTLLGIGGIIGTGIFVLTGTAAANHAGPALPLSFIVAGIGCTIITWGAGTELYIPFWKGPVVDLWIFYPFFAAFVVVAFGNAVNLTDGLDGLASMPVIIAALAFLVILGPAERATWSARLRAALVRTG